MSLWVATMLTSWQKRACRRQPNDPLKPKLETVVPLVDGRASMLQFRYLFVTDKEGLKVIDVTHPEQATLLANNTIALQDALQGICFHAPMLMLQLAQGLVIVDVRILKKCGSISGLLQMENSTTPEMSFWQYQCHFVCLCGRWKNGMKVLQMTSPDSQPKFYGFSPAPKPELISWYGTSSPALSLSRPLERDRGADETGNQVAVFGRLGARPLNRKKHNAYI